ncbi:O-antigen ligase family protein [uncultured Alistipes sp.]|uniref:O-antigen ligase family protein n=1 Tax=uncultured Alistipes sp. TaxID=538949 RepID=UPI0025D00C48|nr:O-antigen ligase family protein [uncultured Alistipes sp.]
MERYGSITTPVSVPRLIVWALLAGGVAVLAMTFTKYGVLAGLAVSAIPAALCILWVTLRDPGLSMLGLFVVNYFIMALTRYAHDLPFGLILDALIFYNILIISLQAMMHRIEWKRASSGLTVVAAIWVAYCTLEVVNPESVSVAGWFSSVRSVAFYFFFITVLTQLTMSEYKYLKYMLIIWSVLTLIAVAKACIQKFIGFNAAENYWLFVLGGRSTHIIRSGVRYFSFFSDAANFGASMGLSMVVFSISALYYRNPWIKTYLLLVAAAACYGMLISGTRSALAVPFIGYTAFIMMSRNIKVIVAGILLVLAAFVFLKFTTIGQGNAIVRRARSAFNTQDASFQVRLENQAKLRELMRDKPFGAGLGHGGGKAKTFAPDAPLSQIPTDSWFVMIWVETGVVGILLHIGILLYILARGAWLVVFKLRNVQLRGFTAALTAGISGIVVMAYANEVLGQIPTGAILYMCMGFIFLAPRFDRELTRKEILDKAMPAQRPPLRENYE